MSSSSLPHYQYFKQILIQTYRALTYVDGESRTLILSTFSLSTVLICSSESTTVSAIEPVSVGLFAFTMLVPLAHTVQFVAEVQNISFQPDCKSA